MGKIQTEVVSMLQAGMRAGSSYRTSGSDAAFNKLLKGQNQSADDKAKETTLSGKDPQKKVPDKGKEETKPVKESGQKEETEDLKDDNSVKNGEMVPSELLLQLQESAGQLAVALTETVAETSEQTGEVLETSGSPELMVQLGEENLGNVDMASQSQVLGKTDELSSVAKVLTDQTAVEEKLEVHPEETISEKAVPVERQEEWKAERPSEVLEGTAGWEAGKTEQLVRNSGTELKGNAQENKTQEQPLMSSVQRPEQEYAVYKMDQPVSEPVKTSEPTLVNDVSRAIAQRLPANDGTLTIELEPASLGKLTIHVLYESGKATVSILATNPRTLELLNAKAAEMGSILEERTGQETIVYTEQPEREQSFDERQAREQQRGQEQENKERKEQTDQDSFLQQLRLGVI